MSDPEEALQAARAALSERLQVSFGDESLLRQACGTPPTPRTAATIR
ncbi:MAG: hypothetical protein M5U09_28150 [Gammaproteobacteria bacterium]|nr:hypothetical protein [Gammaproteobacteria bacterium]